jgi:AMP-activated protein kinase-like protein
VTRRARRAAPLILLAMVGLAPAARSQEWQASARVGRITYEGTPAGASGTSSLVLGVNRASVSDWLGASAAVPLGDDPFWAVLSGWKRIEARGTFGPLLDVSAQGFIQRQSSAAGPSQGPLAGPFQQPTIISPDPSGEGAGGELMPGLYAGRRTARFELRAGVAGQRSSFAGVVQQRLLPTGDVRLILASGPLAPTQLSAQGEMRTWLEDTVTHLYAGGTLQLVRGPIRLWSTLGRWVSGGRDGVTWSVGGAAALGPQMELQLGGRGNAYDPLYLTSTATSVWGGLSLRLGGSRRLEPPVPAMSSRGDAVIRIPLRFAKGTPSIAGDFTGWKPVPMERAGSSWVFTSRLSPGVYHYAFVAEDGTWFVPDSVPGRQSDGMGGQVAVLVVQ